MNIKSVNDKKQDVQAMEPLVRSKMSKGTAIAEPDYDAMWMRMELEWERSSEAASAQGSTRRAPMQMRVRKVALATVLGAALAAVPAYAAFQYDWSDILTDREGIQTALAQGLGQKIEQSVKHDGVTLTLHTAFTHEDRTLILYSLDPDSEKGTSFDFSRLAITDSSGQRHEVSNIMQLPNEDGVVQGYFETDWSPEASSEAVQFSAEELGFYENREIPLEFNVGSPHPQMTDIGRDGVQAIQIQALDGGDGRTLLRTTIIPESGESENQAFPSLLVYDQSGKQIQWLHHKSGMPGEGNATLNDSYYDTTSLLQQGVSFKLAYNRITERSDSSWDFPLILDKSQVEHATAKQKLNVTIGEGDEPLKIDNLTISPSQIRLGLRDGSASSSFAEYKLVVDGRELDQPLYLKAPQNSESALVLERPADLTLSADSKIELQARHAIVTHKGDLPAPVMLTNISENKQTILSQVGGYPVSWTYYRQNGDLYVQTSSSSSNFGGIGQTHIGTGRDRLLTEPIRDYLNSMITNRTTEIYPDYTGDTAEMHIFSYTEHMPSKEVQVQLYPAK
ncbi:DUF4179 domain-containing protein [Saccharibacillus kuerlensis]|uniref:DUF4179 domain-containing protein n=1 Tax=Saccharibacillus kuerlensis TaxID=459527 RepID=A0ABQ2KXX6_9BACL|nr:DUF4179 domain-containing protein [Saccharibacillus kuerlensis]GGN96250.1 hypothetical protein GCM10010969_13010 [Saccharibacillus kuerlensis]